MLRKTSPRSAGEIVTGPRLGELLRRLPEHFQGTRHGVRLRTRVRRGDDPRDIDRNVSARAGKPFVRQYVEERELTVVIAVDLSGSQSFGSADRLKRESTTEVGAALAFAALQNNDKVGLAVFTDGLERWLPPRKGRRHVLAVIREILAYEPRGLKTAIGPSLERLARMLKRRCIVVVISDFRDSGFERALKLCALKHDLIAVVVEDPLESALPPAAAIVAVRDPETGAEGVFDLRSDGGEFSREEAVRRAELDKIFRSSGVEAVTVTTDKPSLDPLLAFFRKRAKRRSR